LKNNGKFDHAGMFKLCEMESSVSDKVPVAGSWLYG